MIPKILYSSGIREKETGYKPKTGLVLKESILLLRGRCQPDSNWCQRFCRPVPNHSDMAPKCVVSCVCECKVKKLSWDLQIISYFV